MSEPTTGNYEVTADDFQATNAGSFIGDEWEHWDYIIHMRPDLVFNRPVHAWHGFTWDHLMFAHVETPWNEPSCEAARNMNIPKGHDLGENLPAVSDAFIGYPSWYAPILFEGVSGGRLTGRGAIQAAHKIVRDKCGAYMDLRDPSDPKYTASSDSKPLWLIMQHVSVLVKECHNTRSIHPHPLYHIYGVCDRLEVDGAEGECRSAPCMF